MNWNVTPLGRAVVPGLADCRGIKELTTHSLRGDYDKLTSFEGMGYGKHAGLGNFN